MTVARQLTINKEIVTVESPDDEPLLWVLRDRLNLVGTRFGCGEGECGACTVLINGLPVNSCLVPVIQVQGAEVVTVEGLANDGRLSALQDAFVRCGATQCGICTPGFLVTAHALLAKNPHPTRDEARDALQA